jgi:thiol:disulfide interchange protein DsbD
MLMPFIGISIVSCGASTSPEAVIDVSVPSAPAASLFAVATAVPKSPEHRAQPLAWLAWDPGVEARARDERRPLLVYAYADWCMACKELERRVFSDEGVQRASASYLTVKLDLTDADNPATEQMSRAFSIDTMPSLLLIDESTGARAEIAGFVDAPTLTERMRRFTHER